MPRTDPDHIPYKDRPVLDEVSPADHASDDIVVDHPTDGSQEGDQPPKQGLFVQLNSFLAGLPKPAKVALLAFVALLLFLLPLIKVPILDTPGADFASVLFYPAGIYVLIAIGLNVVVGEAGLLDLGYVGFFAIGGYVMASLGTSAHIGKLFGFEKGIPFIILLPVGIAISMFAGVILGTPTLRLRGDYLAIVTLGFGEIIRIVANNTAAIGGPRGISGIPHPIGIPAIDTFLTGVKYSDPVRNTTSSLRFGVLDAKPYYWLLLILIIGTIGAVWALEHSRVGRAWTAIREDEDAAELMGVPTFTFKLWAFAIGAGIGGMAGVMYASKVTAIVPDNFQFLLSVLFLAAVVLGGSGNLPGVIVGAFVVAYLPERFRFLVDYRFMVFGLVLVLMMIFRPEGLWPRSLRSSQPPLQCDRTVAPETEKVELKTEQAGEI